MATKSGKTNGGRGNSGQFLGARIALATGATVAVLLGAQMFVRLHSIMVSGNPAIDEYLKQIRGGLEVDTLIVSLSSGREFWFTRAQLQRHLDADGYPIYSFTFPNTMEELRKLQR